MKECSSSDRVPSVNVIPALHEGLWNRLLAVAAVPQGRLVERKVKGQNSQPWGPRMAQGPRGTWARSLPCWDLLKPSSGSKATKAAFGWQGVCAEPSFLTLSLLQS